MRNWIARTENSCLIFISIYWAHFILTQKRIQQKKRKKKEKKVIVWKNDFVYISPLHPVSFFFFLLFFSARSSSSKKENNRLFLFCSALSAKERERERKKKPPVPVYRPWIVLVLSLDYFRSDEDEYWTRLTHAHTSVQPTLIVLANFEEKRKMTKTVLLMIQ